jgi:hypothetical protein
MTNTRPSQLERRTALKTGHVEIAMARNVAKVFPPFNK